MVFQKLGAPKTMKEAIERCVCFRPDLSMKINDWVLANMKDFISMKFGIAYLRAATDEKTLVQLQDLYKSIFKEEA